jgi:hypothetical protein
MPRVLTVYFTLSVLGTGDREMIAEQMELADAINKEASRAMSM